MGFEPTPPKRLEEVLLRLRRYGLKLNLGKSEFGASRCHYLGYIVENGTVTPGQDKTRAIRETPVPTRVREVRAFIGLANYFRFLIRDFATLVQPLNALTRKDCRWKPGETLPEEALRSFNILKSKLCSSPVVVLPKTGWNLRLTTDAAVGSGSGSGGYGAVLSQVNEEVKEEIIAYGSRALRQHERNYSAFLAEMNAAAWGIEHFHPYLYGRRFELHTDHKPLTSLTTTQKRMLKRLEEQLLEYDFVIRYRPAEENAVADFLSRNAVAAITLTFDKDLKEMQQAEPAIHDIRNF